MLSILLTSFGSNSILAQPNSCDPCPGVPWGPVQTHQWYFTPMSLPSCVMFGELRYRTRMCNGQIMYELLGQQFTVISGGCNFAMCIYAELHKDVEKEMLLNVLGSTNVIASKPSACYRLLELNPNDPLFIDCWTHHGYLAPQSNPFLMYPCSFHCCIAQASVHYGPTGKPIIFWNPLTTQNCDSIIPPPTVVSYTACCDTTLINGEVVCTNEQVFNLAVTDTGVCTAYCSSSMFWREGVATNIQEANNFINANIKFQRETMIFPNPSNDKFNIKLELPRDQEVMIELIDIKGQQVKKLALTYRSSQNNYILETSDLKPGIYLCRIKTEDFDDKIIKVTKQ